MKLLKNQILVQTESQLLLVTVSDGYEYKIVSVFKPFD